MTKGREGRFELETLAACRLHANEFLECPPGAQAAPGTGWSHSRLRAPPRPFAPCRAPAWEDDVADVSDGAEIVERERPIKSPPSSSGTSPTLRHATPRLRLWAREWCVLNTVPRSLLAHGMGRRPILPPTPLLLLLPHRCACLECLPNVKSEPETCNFS